MHYVLQYSLNVRNWYLESRKSRQIVQRHLLLMTVPPSFFAKHTASSYLLHHAAIFHTSTRVIPKVLSSSDETDSTKLSVVRGFRNQLLRYISHPTENETEDDLNLLRM